MMQVRDLTVRYGERVVAHIGELDLAPGSITGIAGESGSGKSQTALAIMGLGRYSGADVSGSVRLDDLELTTLSSRAWRRSVAVAWR